MGGRAHTYFSPELQSSEKYICSDRDSKPYRFDSESRPFPKANINMYSEKFQRYLK